MIFSISIIAINENKTIFSEMVNKDEENNLSIFSIKIISGKKIIISENDKKIIVYFNEIFMIKNDEFVIINNKDIVSLFAYFHEKNEFEFLIRNDMYKYIHQFFKNIFYLRVYLGHSNIKCIPKIFLFLSILSFIFSNNQIKPDKLIENNKLLIQKKIYLLHEKIESMALAENIPKIPTTFPLKQVNLEIKKQNTTNQMNNNRKINKKLFRKELDNEIQYFIQFKKNSRH